MLPSEFLSYGDGIIEAKKEHLNRILMTVEIDQHYDVEEKPFAR